MYQSTVKYPDICECYIEAHGHGIQDAVRSFAVIWNGRTSWRSVPEQMGLELALGLAAVKFPEVLSLRPQRLGNVGRHSRVVYMTWNYCQPERISSGFGTGICWTRSRPFYKPRDRESAQMNRRELGESSKSPNIRLRAGIRRLKCVGTSKRITQQRLTGAGR